MVISRAHHFDELAFSSRVDIPEAGKYLKLGLLLLFWLLMLGFAHAQGTDVTTSDETPVEISGSSDSTVFGMGHTIRITGNVKQGAMALGGDVIVEGTVEGDVAAVGGSVIQAAGARIGGDVIVLGGTYKHLDAKPNRNESSMTMMYAGYEQTLRSMMRNPAVLLRPHWSSGYLGR